MSKKSQTLTLDQENEEKARYGGVLKNDILSAASAIGSQKEKSAQASGDLSGKLEVFEKKGGHKKAIKWAKAMTDMEPHEGQDFFRLLKCYLDALGFHEQGDMIDQMNEMELRDSSVALASKPQQGAEPSTVN